jgi:hypothetical protein
MIRAAPHVGKIAPSSVLELARRVLSIEAEAVRALIDRLDQKFIDAVERCLQQAVLCWVV